MRSRNSMSDGEYIMLIYSGKNLPDKISISRVCQLSLFSVTFVFKMKSARICRGVNLHKIIKIETGDWEDQQSEPRKKPTQGQNIKYPALPPYPHISRARLPGDTLQHSRCIVSLSQETRTRALLRFTDRNQHKQRAKGVSSLNKSRLSRWNWEFWSQITPRDASMNKIYSESSRT